MDYTDVKTWNKSEYFLKEFFEPLLDEVLIDGGAYDGDTIEEFAEWTQGRFKHIYSFEPQRSLADKVRSSLWKYNNKVTFIEKGLWSC